MVNFALPPQRLIIQGTDGRPMLVFDLDNRTIDVPADVEVSEAARAVFEALKQYLSPLPILHLECCTSL